VLSSARLQILGTSSAGDQSSSVENQRQDLPGCSAIGRNEPAKTALGNQN
jgi:hypothetical protein